MRKVGVVVVADEGRHVLLRHCHQARRIHGGSRARLPNSETGIPLTEPLDVFVKVGHALKTCVDESAQLRDAADCFVQPCMHLPRVDQELQQICRGWSPLTDRLLRFLLTFLGLVFGVQFHGCSAHLILHKAVFIIFEHVAMAPVPPMAMFRLFSFFYIRTFSSHCCHSNVLQAVEGVLLCCKLHMCTAVLSVQLGRHCQHHKGYRSKDLA
mmetsp:Transcript_36275/g.60571  ORF Transcript_36275/g.60571 Transcript_36275/m.60571 type:complete len:211 (+) Transcript_36275:286-918(+)